MENYEFHILNSFVNLALLLVKKDQNLKNRIADYFLRISVILLKTFDQFSTDMLFNKNKVQIENTNKKEM